MGIRKIQVTRKVEEIITSYLYRGRYPTFQTITHHFGQWLREHTPGAPVFNPLKVFRKEKSSSENYNQEISALTQDVNDSYESTISQTTQLMSDFSFIDTERGKLIHQLASISNSIDEMLLISSNADYQYFDGHVISFEDSADVNKEKSTAFVNVINKEVTLLENISQSNRVLVNASKASFQSLQPSTQNTALESLSNAFDDNINTAWWHVVKTKELGADNSMKAELVVMFDDVEEVNYIEYVPHHGKPVDMKIEYTNDGSVFTSIYQQAETDMITGIKIWNFQKISTRGIKFVFEKREYDERNNDYYNYYFGAKSIGIYKKNYLSEGMFYTNPIHFIDNIQQMSIYAKNDTPFNTDLRYEVALYESEKNLEELIWHPISSFDETKPKFAKVINLNVKENKKAETSKAEATGQMINGMQVFRLMKDNGDGIMSEKIMNTQTGETLESFDDFQSPKLFRGINQWKRERTYVSFDGSVPLNSKWDDQYLNRPEIIRADYHSKTNELDLSRVFGGFDDNFFRFSICVYSDEPRNEPLSLSVMSTLSSGIRKRLGAYSVYVNRQRLAPANDEVTMPFIKGWNEIQILYHWGDMQERKDTERKNLPQEAFVGKFNFMKESRVRGDLEYMQYVDVHSLYHNISPNNRNYFTIHERQVVLNYLPEHCVFQMTYESNKQLEQRNQIVLRAQLSRDISVPHVTPKIYTIRLRVK
jgi:hypothetical protein